MNLETFCTQIQTQLPDCLKQVPPENDRKSELSHARIRLNESDESKKFWQHLQGDVPFFKFKTLAPHNGKFICWGKLRGVHPLASTLGLNWLEITTPNANHQTGFDALVYKSFAGMVCPAPSTLQTRPPIQLIYQPLSATDILK